MTPRVSRNPPGAGIGFCRSIVPSMSGPRIEWLLWNGGESVAASLTVFLDDWRIDAARRLRAARAYLRKRVALARRIAAAQL